MVSFEPRLRLPYCCLRHFSLCVLGACCAGRVSELPLLPRCSPRCRRPKNTVRACAAFVGLSQVFDCACALPVTVVTSPAGRALSGSAVVKQYEKRRVADALMQAKAFEGPCRRCRRHRTVLVALSTMRV